MDSPAIETRALTRRFGTRPAVDSLALSVPQGCIYGFLGPNGAGKTTTIRLLLGLLRPNEGNIFLYGEPFTWERRDLLRDVGALVETPSVYPHLTGRENLDLTRRILGLPGASVEESLDLTGLCADAGRVVRTYSLGMRQRLGLALARLGKPRLLILDEPANGLDPAGTRELRALLLQLAKEHQVTIFLSNHLLSEVEHIADHIGVINRGQLVFQGELRELRRCQPPLIVSVDRPLEAAHLLNASGWRAVEDSNHALSVHAVSETEAAQVNRALVMGGIHVYEIRRQEVTLEELFSPACRPSGHRRRRMNGFFRVVTVEGLKLRRTLAFRLAVLAPLFIVILQFTIELVRASEESGASPGLNPLRACFENRSGRGLRARRGDWRGATREHIREKSVTEEQRSQPPRPAARPPEIFSKHALMGFAQGILTFWTIVLLPFCAALIAAQLAALEHQGDNWKHILALPVPRTFIFAAKWMAAAGLLSLSSVVLVAAYCLAAAILQAVKTSWSAASWPVVTIVQRVFLGLCASGTWD